MAETTNPQQVAEVSALVDRMNSTLLELSITDLREVLQYAILRHSLTTRGVYVNSMVEIEFGNGNIAVFCEDDRLAFVPLDKALPIGEQCSELVEKSLDEMNSVAVLKFTKPLSALVLMAHLEEIREYLIAHPAAVAPEDRK